MSSKYVESSFSKFVKNKLNEIKQSPKKDIDEPIEDEEINDDDLEDDPEIDFDEDDEKESPKKLPVGKGKKNTKDKPKFGSSQYIQELKREFEAIINQYPK